MLDRADLHFGRGPFGKVLRLGQGARTSGPRPRWVPMLDDLDVLLHGSCATSAPFPARRAFADESGGRFDRRTIRNRLGVCSNWKALRPPTGSARMRCARVRHPQLRVRRGPGGDPADARSFDGGSTMRMSGRQRRSSRMLTGGRSRPRSPACRRRTRMEIKWRLRMAAAQREVWTGAQLRRLLLPGRAGTVLGVGVSVVQRATRAGEAVHPGGLVHRAECTPDDLFEVDTTPAERPAAPPASAAEGRLRRPLDAADLTGRPAMKRQRDCARCGAAVGSSAVTTAAAAGTAGRQRQPGTRARAAAWPACSWPGRAVDMLAGVRRLRRPVRRRDRNRCTRCHHRREREQAGQACPRCGKPGYLREQTGWCGSCSRPGPPKEPRICAGCGEVDRHCGLAGAPVLAEEPAAAVRRGRQPGRPAYYPRPGSATSPLRRRRVRPFPGRQAWSASSGGCCRTADRSTRRPCWNGHGCPAGRRAPLARTLETSSSPAAWPCEPARPGSSAAGRGNAGSTPFPVRSAPQWQRSPTRA